MPLALLAVCVRTVDGCANGIVDTHETSARRMGMNVDGQEGMPVASQGRKRARGRGRRAAACVVVVAGALVVVGVFWRHAEARWLFMRLVLARRDTARARSISRKLARTRQGIALCIRDFNVYGGRTRGWSSWALVQSRLTDCVEGALVRTIEDPAAPPHKRIEALWIMWQRTRYESYLRELYDSCRDPGPHAVEVGRRYLLAVFAAHHTARQFDVPASEAIRMHPEEFDELIRSFNGG